MDLASCLNQMGARITGAGTSTVSIVGVGACTGPSTGPFRTGWRPERCFAPPPSPKEACWYRARAPTPPVALFKLAETGVGIRETPAGIRLSGTAVSPFELRTLAYRVPTDMRAP